MIRQLLGVRPRLSRRQRELQEDRIYLEAQINNNPDFLDDLYEDDTIDVKNFGRMDEGPAKEEFRQMLKDRMRWYMRLDLIDWAEQIDIALQIDEEHS